LPDEIVITGPSKIAEIILISEQGGSRNNRLDAFQEGRLIQQLYDRLMADIYARLLNIEPQI
jgi:hypothetical protein